ncbi:MAG: ARMT1-like domain-containing protein [Dehalococcoidales bacterium]|nr:ARMT1-like domain-containing protein [Dehalococcoidales bacterium]
MQTYLDCIPCLLTQALRAARATTDDVSIHRRVIDSVAGMVPRLSLDLRPPEIAQQFYRLISNITGDADPFREAKIEANRAALSRYTNLKKIVADTEDPLFTACKLAIAGNSMDFGNSFGELKIDEIIDNGLSSHIAVNDYDRFRECISRSQTVIYLGDNAGEILFDRLLIEEILRIKHLDIVFVVREKPIINDVTIDDACMTGMDKIARIIANGSDAPATILSQCSPEMLSLYYSADMIISKGQGNYESLNEDSKSMFFLLRAKCRLIADMLRVKIGDHILKYDSVH